MIEQTAEELIEQKKKELADEVRYFMGPGYIDTWLMILVKRTDPRAVKVKAIEEGQDIIKTPFPLEFSSHPGLAIILGP